MDPSSRSQSVCIYLSRVSCGRHRRYWNHIRVQMPSVRQVDVRPWHRHAMLPKVPAAVHRHVRVEAWPRLSTRWRHGEGGHATPRRGAGLLVMLVALAEEPHGGGG